MNNSKLKTKLFEVLELHLIKFLESDPLEFVTTDEFQQNRLFIEAFIPLEMTKAAWLHKKFQENFNDIWGKLATAATEQNAGIAIKQHTIYGTAMVGRLRRIQAVLSRLEYAQERIKPDWNAELAYILKGKGAPIPVSIACDFHTENVQTGEHTAYFLDSLFPNSNQTKQIKEKIFKLFAMDSKPVDAAYYALPYNPYGQKADYAGKFPARWFDMRQDEVVLIGAEFWDKIGGVGTYTAFIEAINEISLPYKERIYREFLGIEPLETTAALLR